MPRWSPARSLRRIFERMTIIRGKLADVGIPKSDHESNLHILQCLSPDYEVDKKILQYAPNLTLTMIEDRARATYGEIQRKGKTVNGRSHVLVVAAGGGSGGHGLFPTPGHHTGGSTGGSAGK